MKEKGEAREGKDEQAERKENVKRSYLGGAITSSAQTRGSEEMIVLYLETLPSWWPA